MMPFLIKNTIVKMEISEYNLEDEGNPLEYIDKGME